MNEPVDLSTGDCDDMFEMIEESSPFFISRMAMIALQQSATTSARLWEDELVRVEPNEERIREQAEMYFNEIVNAFKRRVTECIRAQQIELKLQLKVTVQAKR